MPAPPDVAGRAWDRAASLYDLQLPLEAASLAAAVRLAAAQPGDVVVDLGSGTGAVARLLRTAGAERVVAVDMSAAMLRRQRTQAGRRLQASATALPLASASVDVVVCGWLLHLLDDDARGAALHHVSRVLRPGGRLTVAVPTQPRTAAGRLVRSAARRAADRAGVSVLSVVPALPRELAAAGLPVRREVRTRLGYAAQVLLAVRQ